MLSSSLEDLTLLQQHDQANAGRFLREASFGEVPSWVRDAEAAMAAVAAAENDDHGEQLGRGHRKRSSAIYDDDCLTENEFVELIESGEDIQEYTKRKRSKKKEGTLVDKGKLQAQIFQEY